MLNLTNHPMEEPVFFREEYQFQQIFIYHIWLSILLFGLTSNVTNIIVFLRIGLRDNVTVTLLFLSISDLINLMLLSPATVELFMSQVVPKHNWPFDKYILEYLLYWHAYIFYDYSSFISVFLGLVRCACVVRPLLFKSTFTITRTYIVLVALFVMALSLRAPVLNFFRLNWALNPQTNSTWVYLDMSPDNRYLQKINDIVNRNIVSSILYIIAIVCAAVLIVKLRAASKFRQSLLPQKAGREASSKQKTKERSQALSESTGRDQLSQNDPETMKNGTKSTNHNSSANKMSAKDMQVVQSVTLICAIFILSQLPFQLISIVTLIDPEFAMMKKRRYAYGFAIHISRTCSYFNASVNIFVYFFFNSRYRETLLGLYSKKPNKV